MKTKILSLVVSSSLLVSLINALPTKAAQISGRGEVTVTVIDEETNELFDEDRINFSIIGGGLPGSSGGGGAIHLSSWNTAESNPHTVSDVSKSFGYGVQYTGIDYDGYTYYIDTEKSDTHFNFLESSTQEVTIYMKKNYWGNSGEDAETEPPIDDEEDKTEPSFDELYNMSDEELKAYCDKNEYYFMSRAEAVSMIYSKTPINIMLKPKDYQLNDDLIESEDPSRFAKYNYADYDFEKMIADLGLPEEYYIIDRERCGFQVYFGMRGLEPLEMYYKLAKINLQLDLSVDDSCSVIRLYQLMTVIPQRNDNYYTFSPMYAGGSSMNTGDINCDGDVSIADLLVMQRYLLGSSNVGEKIFIFGDLNKDGKVDVFDMIRMRKKLIGG